MLEALAQGTEMDDCTVVWTKRQTAGRGQMGNGWESEADKNISFSMLLKPEFIHPREQFVISQLTALAVAESVALDGVSIKWPNDIYVDDDKLAGILIENRLQGQKLSHCVLGIGININQEHWVGNAPNPTSMKLKSGIETDPEEMLNKVTQRITHYYTMLKADTVGTTALIKQRFMQKLYRREGFFPYRDAESGEAFEAKINDILTDGRMVLGLADGTERTYWFKEVKFVLPCGVTKE